jgi:hypothetical protein
VSGNPNLYFETVEFLGGAFGNVTIYLRPGQHFVELNREEGASPSADFVVTGSAPEIPEPAADVQVELLDFNFAMPDEIKAGPKVWRITNGGSQWHHLGIWRLNPEATQEQFVEWAMAEEPEGPPPAEPIVGWSPTDPGLTGWVTFDLPAGEYVVVCFLPDFTAMPPLPHLAHGMVRALCVTE